MNPAPLVVLALAMLGPSFSEGDPMSRCELRKQLTNSSIQPDIRMDLRSLVTVICEVGKVINAPVVAPTTAPTRTRLTPGMTFATMAQDLPTLGPQDGFKLRGCIVILDGTSRIDIKCIKKHFDKILKNAGPECSSVSTPDYFEGC